MPYILPVESASLLIPRGAALESDASTFVPDCRAARRRRVGDGRVGLRAYNWVGGKWPQAGVPGPCEFSCAPTPVTVTYSFQNMFDGGLLMPNGQPLPAPLIKSSIEEALGLWASVAPLHFVEVEDDGLFYYEGSTQYGQIRFRHIYINGPDPPPPALPIAKAQAYFPFGTGYLAGDVEFDHSDPLARNRHTPAARYPRRHHPRARPLARPGAHRSSTSQLVLDLHAIRRSRHGRCTPTTSKASNIFMEKAAAVSGRSAFPNRLPPR